MSGFEKDILARVYEEAAEISKTERVAAVFLLPKGRYVATSTNPHLITGKLIARFVDGRQTTE